MGEKVDFFISRRGDANEVAQEVAGVLQDAGYTTRMQDYDIGTSDNFVGAMHEMLVVCQDFIAILTRDYASATYTREEWTNFFQIEKTSNGLRRLIPLRVEDFEPEGLFAAKVYADLVGIIAPEQRRQVILAAARKKPGGRPPHRPSPSPTKPHGKIFRSVPPKNPDFTGRMHVLIELHRMFAPADRNAAVTQIAVHGLGGVGKTSLAAEYARRHQDDYGGVWWAPAESRTVLLGSLAELGAVLDPRLAGGQDIERSARAALDKLSESAQPWLLIYDNVPDPDGISDLVPTAGARLLLTTRWTEWSGYAEELAVGEMDDETAIDFLLKQTGRSDRAGAARLAAALGYLPLALRQAGAYVKLTGNSFDSYAARCTELIARAPWGTVRQPSVRGTFSMAIEKATADCPETDLLLAFLAVLAPERIPLDLVDQTVLPESDAGNALMALSAVSLVAHDAFADGTAAISIHRLVRDAMRWRLEQAQRMSAMVDKTIARLAAVFPDDGYMEPKSAPRCKQLLPHALTVCESALRANYETLELARLLDAAANYLNSHSDYVAAERLYRDAIVIGEKILEADHPRLGEWKNNLGNLLLNTGRYRDAETEYREAIRIGTIAAGRKTAQIATRINNLGVVLMRTGQYVAAEELFREAIQICGAVGAPADRLAARMNNLAIVLAKTDRFVEAELLHRKAIEIGAATLGKDHPRVIYWTTELANSLRDAGRYEEAEQMYSAAIARLVETDGETHLSVGHTRDELARLLLATGRLEQARIEAAQALAIRENALGADHQWTLQTVKLLADTLVALGRPGEAAQVKARYGAHRLGAAAG